MAEDTEDKKPKYGKSTEELLEKLRQSLQRDGDFPASARVVNELKALTSRPKTTANQITEVILREPSLGTRVLHLVNSSFYRRAKPIMTVSQAVVQIGMRPLAELCAGLVLLQKFVPTARRGGPFAVCLKQSIVTSLLASQIGTELTAASGKSSASKDEQGYLVGSFSELGALLLAYYFPKIYESAAKRSEAKDVPMDQSIKELTGLTPLQLSLEVLDALHLPDYYKEVLSITCDYVDSGKAPAGIEPDSSGKLPPELIAKHVTAAQSISRVIVNSNNKSELDKVLGALASKYNIDPEIMSKSVGSLPTLFKDHCAAIELNLPSLPEFVSNYDVSEPSSDNKAAPTEVKIEDKFAQFVDEIRQTVESREPTATVITSVMETFAWSLSFDRVVLLLVDQPRTKLLGRMGLGALGEIDPKQIERDLGEKASRYAPDAQAFAEARPVFNGDPVLEDGWPLAAIPIGYGSRALGVIYADRVNPENDELDPREQAAIGVLAELLDRSVGLNSEP